MGDSPPGGSPLEETSPQQLTEPPKRKLTKAERLAAEDKRKRECVPPFRKLQPTAVR